MFSDSAFYVWTLKRVKGLDLMKAKNFIFSECGHVAYQIKGNEV